jgi:hypothetical protein
MQLFEAPKSGGRVRAQVALMEEEASKLTSETSEAVKANTFRATKRPDHIEKMKVNTRVSLATGNDGTCEEVGAGQDLKEIIRSSAEMGVQVDVAKDAPPALVINAERQVKPAPPRLSGHVHFKAPPQGCGHDRPGEVAPWATKLDAQREAAGERTRATYAACRGRIGWTKTAVAPVPPPPTTAYTATDGREFTLPMARPAQPRVEMEEVRQERRNIAEEVRRERIQRAAKYMRYNRKWFDDENRVRGKGEKAPYDLDLDVLALSPAEWKEVDAALALTKQRGEAQVDLDLVAMASL